MTYVALATTTYSVVQGKCPFFKPLHGSPVSGLKSNPFPVLFGEGQGSKLTELKGFLVAGSYNSQGKTSVHIVSVHHFLLFIKYIFR